MSGGLERSISTAVRGGRGSAASAPVWPSHGSSSFALSSAVSGFTLVTPFCLARKRETSVIFFSMSAVLTGSSSTVISLAISLTHALADWLTMYTAPKVRQAREDMKAITTVSALPAMEAEGTIWAVLDWKRAGRRPARRAGNSPVKRLVQG